MEVFMNENARACQNALFGLLAKEYNCTPEDFLREENVVTVSATSVTGSR